MWPSSAVAVAMNISAPATLDQETTLSSHTGDTVTLLGAQRPGKKGCKMIKYYLFELKLKDTLPQVD